MTREEFNLLQEKLDASGLGIMKFLRQEKINYSTYTKWRRRFIHPEESLLPKEQLVPVTISTPKNEAVTSKSLTLTICFPNGVNILVPAGMEASAVELITLYPHSNVLP